MTTGQEVRPVLTSCRMMKDLAGRYKPDARFWYVFEADWGGQILATVPVTMIPAWVGRRRLRRALRAMNGMWNDESASVYIVIDVGEYPAFAEYADDPEQYHCHTECTTPWVERKQMGALLPLGLCAAFVAKEPFDEPTKLADWKFVGWVEGGMGGGRLLEGDAWFHYQVLHRGKDDVNEIRRLLGLPKLRSFDLVMAPREREHVSLIDRVLG